MSDGRSIDQVLVFHFSFFRRAHLPVLIQIWGNQVPSETPPIPSHMRQYALNPMVAKSEAPLSKTLPYVVYCNIFRHVPAKMKGDHECYPGNELKWSHQTPSLFVWKDEHRTNSTHHYRGRQSLRPLLALLVARFLLICPPITMQAYTRCAQCWNVMIGHPVIRYDPTFLIHISRAETETK